MTGDLTVSLPLLALFAVIAWIALIYAVVARPHGSGHAPPGRHFYRAPMRPEKIPAPNPKNAEQQLDTVIGARFQRRPLLNRSEYRVFRLIEDDLAAARRGYRVFAQTNLGEILESSDRSAFSSVNSKRVDFLIVDRGGWPVVAVEYQGTGHYQGNAGVRDAVKMVALRNAGIRFVEIFPKDSDEQIRARVRGQLGWKMAANTKDSSSAVSNAVC